MKLKRKLLIRICILAVALTIALEIFSRAYLGLGTPPLTAYHPTIEYYFKPNQDVYRFHNHFLVNDYGMRSSRFSRSKRPGEYRVMVFGDSVVNGGNLTDHEALATTKLQRLITEKTGNAEVVVGNVSAGSWGPGNWLAYLREFGAFDADVIVLVLSSHDIADNPTFKELSTNTHPTHTPPLALVEAVTRYLPQYLPAFLKPKVPAEQSLTGEQSSTEVAKGQQDLKEFLELALGVSPKVLVLQHWAKSEIEAGSPQPGNAQVRQVCREVGIEPYSLEADFRKEMDLGNNPFRDDIHINDRGQKILAEVLARQIGVNPK